MAVISWDIRLYDMGGNEIDMLQQCKDPHISVPLNGIDNFDATMYLDDPVTQDIRALDRVVKVWRTVNDTANSKTFTPPAGTPDFSGFVTGVTKNGAANTISFQAQSPLWRLNSRFHLLNHYFVNDYVGSNCNEDGLAFDQSALMFKLIDLVNHAFGSDSKTGIVKPTGAAPFWPKTVAVGGYRVPKGSNTWQHIFEDLMNRPSGADLTPQYIHAAASYYQMYFKTAAKRGSDISGTTHLDYHTGVKNLDDMTEDVQVVPGKFSNYVWAVGQAGYNAAVAKAEDIAGTYGRTNVGIYMSQADDSVIAEIRKLSMLQQIANNELAKAKQLPALYTVAIAPLAPTYWKTDFDCGDVVMLNADRGALSVSSVKQRIYQVDVSLSENSIETCNVLLSKDFAGKVAP